MRTFVELVERYVDPELCPYPEYKGKPYYSIKYIENGEEYVGYSTYSLRVMSEFLKKYFIQSALEKQEPMKPLPQEMDIDGRAITPCGFCGEELPHNSLYDFCPYCGQAIDRRKDG